MPEEHTGQLGFEYAWKELLARSRQAGRYQANCPSPVMHNLTSTRQVIS